MDCNTGEFADTAGVTGVTEDVDSMTDGVTDGVTDSVTDCVTEETLNT